jgi:plastocyanin
MGLVVLGAGLALAGPAAAADQPIAFADFAYNPTPATIRTGDTATFSGSFASHPLVWDANNFATTNTGSSKSFSFSQPGTYLYHCQLHAQTHGMVGQITVVADQHPASVSFGVSPSPRAGQPVTFTYTGSADPDGTLTSWKWDLDGDGVFETTTASGAATATYPTARAVTVRMYAVDDSGEASATAEQAVTIAAAGSGGSGDPGSGASGSRDTTAPKATLVKLAGLKLTFRASEKASATATLRARGKTIARGSAKARSGAITLRLELTKAGRSVLKPGRKLKVELNLTLRDTSGNRRSLKKTLTVRRP